MRFIGTALLALACMALCSVGAFAQDAAATAAAATPAAAVLTAPAPDVIDLLIQNSGTIFSILAGIVTIASIIVAGTPTPDPNTALGRIYKVIEVAALVVGKAKDPGGTAPAQSSSASVSKLGGLVLALLLGGSMLTACAGAAVEVPRTPRETLLSIEYSFAGAENAATSIVQTGAVPDADKAKLQDLVKQANAALDVADATIRNPLAQPTTVTGALQAANAAVLSLIQYLEAQKGHG